MNHQQLSEAVYRLTQAGDTDFLEDYPIAAHGGDIARDFERQRRKFWWGYFKLMAVLGFVLFLYAQFVKPLLLGSMPSQGACPVVEVTR